MAEILTGLAVTGIGLALVAWHVRNDRAGARADRARQLRHAARYSPHLAYRRKPRVRLVVASTKRYRPDHT
jgi:hypothetical protein